jgi:hypothetical protein
MLPRDIIRGEPISASWLNRVKSAIPKSISGGKGIRLTYTANGDVIISLAANIPGVDPEISFYAEIESAAEQASTNKYRYGWRQVELNTDDTWTAVTGGYSGSANGVDYAVNTFESPNTASGTQGNNINVDTLNTGLDFQPIATGAVVRMHLVPMADATPESPNAGMRAVFSGVNLADGECV